MLVRERAGRRSIALQTNIDSQLGQIQADKRKVRQDVLNLLSNAIKFTPEGGRIEVGATPRDGLVEVSVSRHRRRHRPGGSGGGLREVPAGGDSGEEGRGHRPGAGAVPEVCRTARGRIWVKSEVGVGSTFTFTLPVRS